MQGKRTSAFATILVVCLVLAVLTMRGDSLAWFLAKVALALIPPGIYWWWDSHSHRSQRLGYPLGRTSRT
jgi:hypothetical protein